VLTLSVGYASSKKDGASTDSGFGVAAGYSLSKRTSLYVNYARVDNNAGSKLSLIPAAYFARVRPAINGSDPSALAAGVVHLF
jgi:predicted porin